MATVTEVGRPHIVPVTFAVDGNYIYTAVDAKPKNETAARGLQRVRNIEAEPRVALLADHYADDWTSLWWARVDRDRTATCCPADRAADRALPAVPRRGSARPGDRDSGGAVVRLGRVTAQVVPSRGAAAAS